MYLDYYGLSETPFALTPDTQFFFYHHGHQEALNVLLIALESGEGLIKVTGEVGTGKTLLCRKLLDALDPQFYTACIPNPALQPNILRLALAEELGIRVGSTTDQHRLVQLINRRLLELMAAGRKVVVCVDEAQTLPDRSLEALRLLTNLETPKDKLLQLVLFGQPELDAKLQQPELRQVRQRISYSIQLPPLDRNGVDGYLRHRLHVAGYQGDPLFAPTAVDALFRYSRGIPRLINIIGNKAMMLAFGLGSRSVSLDNVRTAARDTEGVNQAADQRYQRMLNLGVGASAAALAASAALWWSAAA